MDKQLICEDNSDYEIRMEVFKYFILNFKYLIFQRKNNNTRQHRVIKERKKERRKKYFKIC